MNVLTHRDLKCRSYVHFDVFILCALYNPATFSGRGSSLLHCLIHWMFHLSHLPHRYCHLLDNTQVTTNIYVDRPPHMFMCMCMCMCAHNTHITGCLIIRTYVFMCCRKDLIKVVVNYVHFNLSISLICGLIVFLAGIQGATSSRVINYILYCIYTVVSDQCVSPVYIIYTYTYYSIQCIV